MEFEPMSPEELQRTMQFLLAQQAKFAVDTDRQIRETNTRMEQLGTRVEQLGDYIKSVESHVDVVVEMFERHLRDDHGQRPS